MFGRSLARRSWGLVAAFCLVVCACDDSSDGGDDEDMAGMGGGDGGGSDDGGAGGVVPDTGPGDMGAGGEGGLMPDGAVCEPCECNQVQDPDTCACSDSADACEADCDCAGNRVCDGEGACVEGCTDDEACSAADPTRPACFAGRCGNCGADDDCFGNSPCADNLCVPVPDCEDSRECAGLRCVDGECVDPLPCGDCPEGWVCDEASGNCQPNRERCREDGECALDLVCVTSINPPGCGRCQHADDCPSQQQCDLGTGTCVEGGCADDGDCVLGRVCNAGACEAPACDEDNFEDNDDFANASEIAAGVEHRDLGGCDDDWYVFMLPARTQVVVTMRQDGFAADLDVEVYDADQRLIGAGRTGNHSDSAAAGPFGNARQVYVRVFHGGAPSAETYSLAIDLEAAADGCLDDAWEAGAGDDIFENGRVVRRAGQPGFADNLVGTVCPGDADFFCFQMGRQEQLVVSAEVTGGNATLVAELMDDMGPVLEGDDPIVGRWPRGQPGENIDVGASGFLCLRVTTETTSGAYALRLDAIPRAVRTKCAQAEVFSVEDAPFDNQELEDDNDFFPLCAPQADGPEAIYHFDDLEPGSMLVARAIGLPNGTLGDPVVSIRNDCTRANSEIGCSDDVIEPDQPLLRQPNPAVARAAVLECPRQDCADEDNCHCASVIVDGIAAGNAPNFRLEVETRPLRPPPQNDVCDDAQVLDLGELGAAGATPSLDQAADDYASCLGTGGPDVVYALQLASDARLTVQTTSVGDDFAVGAYLIPGDACMGAPLACGYGFDEVVPAGSYRLVVDGADVNARGRVEVQVAAELFDDPPANDGCDEALALDGEGGELRGDTRSAEDDVRLADGNGCTGHDSRGGDVVYTIPVADDGLYYVQAEPDGGWDLSLLVLGDCDEPLGDCLGQDGALTETLVFARNGGGDVTVVVDGSNGEAGEFTLRWGPADCEEDRDCADGEQCVTFQCVAGD